MEANKIVTRAVMLCKNRSFQAFLAKKHAPLFRDAETSAIDALYKLCGMNSRRKLVTDDEAKTKFLALIEEFEEAEFDAKYEEVFSTF